MTWISFKDKKPPTSEYILVASKEFNAIGIVLLDEISKNCPATLYPMKYGCNEPLSCLRGDLNYWMELSDIALPHCNKCDTRCIECENEEEFKMRREYEDS